MCLCVCVRGTVLDSISETIVTAPRSGGPSPPSVRVILHVTVFQSLKYKRHCVRSEAFFYLFFLFLTNSPVDTETDFTTAVASIVDTVVKTCPSVN